MESSVAPPDVAQLLKAVDPAELGRRVRSARVARGLTQTALGHPEASAAYVSRIESGQRRPGTDLLHTFATRLGVPVERLLDRTVTLDPDEVGLQLNYAELALESGEVVEAQQRTREVLDGLPQGPGGVASTLRDRAHYLHARALEAQGRLEEAILHLERVRCSGIADLQWVKARLALSRCYRETGDLGRAVDCGRPALDLLSEAGLAHCDEAIQLVVTVAAAYYERGDCGEAQRLCKRAVEEAEREGSPTARASAYWNASMIESKQGSLSTAVTLAERALALLGEGNDGRNLARLRSELGTMQLMTEGADLDEAERTLIRAAEELRSSSAGPVDVARNQLALCKVLLLRGEPERVHAMTQAVLRDVGEGAPDVAAEAEVISGRAWAAQGDPAEAQRAFRRAVRTLSGIGADRTAAELWFELGALWETVGDAEASRDAYRSAAASAGVQLRVALATSALVRGCRSERQTRTSAEPRIAAQQHQLPVRLAAFPPETVSASPPSDGERGPATVASAMVEIPVTTRVTKRDIGCLLPVRRGGVQGNLKFDTFDNSLTYEGSRRQTEARRRVVTG